MDIKYLNNLTIAKESLNVWLSNVEQLYLGNQMFAKANDLDRNNTPFYIWYNGEGQTFSSFETFQVLEPFYNEMYDQFITYINLLNQPIKKSLFSNEKEKREKDLNILYQDLKQYSRKLIKSVELFAEKLKNSPLFTQTEVNKNFEKPATENKFLNDNPFEKNEFFEKKETGTEFNFSDYFNAQEIKKTNTEVPLTSEKIESFDFENKFQEAALKLKRELEAEMRNKIHSSPDEQTKQPPVSNSISTENTTDVSTDSPKPLEIKTETKKPDDAIDIAEEIRRILS